MVPAAAAVAMWAANLGQAYVAICCWLAYTGTGESTATCHASSPSTLSQPAGEKSPPRSGDLIPPNKSGLLLLPLPLLLLLLLLVLVLLKLMVGTEGRNQHVEEVEQGVPQGWREDDDDDDNDDDDDDAGAPAP